MAYAKSMSFSVNNVEKLNVNLFHAFALLQMCGISISYCAKYHSQNSDFLPI